MRLVKIDEKEIRTCLKKKKNRDAQNYNNGLAASLILLKFVLTCLFEIEVIRWFDVEITAGDLCFVIIIFLSVFTAPLLELECSTRSVHPISGLTL